MKLRRFVLVLIVAGMPIFLMNSVCGGGDDPPILEGTCDCNSDSDCSRGFTCNTSANQQGKCDPEGGLGGLCEANIGDPPRPGPEN